MTTSKICRRLLEQGPVRDLLSQQLGVQFSSSAKWSAKAGGDVDSVAGVAVAGAGVPLYPPVEGEGDLCTGTGDVASLAAAAGAGARVPPNRNPPVEGEEDLCHGTKSMFQFQGNKTKDNNKEGKKNLLLPVKKALSCILRGARSICGKLSHSD
jgi:hypothetical protein